MLLPLMGKITTKTKESVMLSKRFFYGMLGLILFLGCSQKQEDKGTDETKGHEMHQHKEMGDSIGAMKSDSKVVIRKARKDEIGKSVECPVMGTKFKVKGDTEAADYKGETYYFCCPGCSPEFKKDPEKYAVKIRKTTSK